MGQCVMKDCGLSTEKLSSPQKKNLRVFLTDVPFLYKTTFITFAFFLKKRIKDRYHPDEIKDKFLSEEEFGRSPHSALHSDKFSVRTPRKGFDDAVQSIFYFYNGGENFAQTDFSWKEEKAKKPLSLGLLDILTSEKNVACILLFLLVLSDN